MSGNLDGFLSVEVSGNRRVIFRFEGPDVFDVDYLDYHPLPKCLPGYDNVNFFIDIVYKYA